MQHIKGLRASFYDYKNFDFSKLKNLTHLYLDLSDNEIMNGDELL